MRWIVIAMLLAGSLCGQEPPKPAEPKPPEAPVPGAVIDEEMSTTIGYRWVPTLNGSRTAYRSVVDLGEGARLLDFTLRQNFESMAWIDRLTTTATGWGGDPYSTAFIDASRVGSYRLQVRHRTLAQYDNLPSYANPFIDRGLLLSQRSIDARRQLTSVLLEIMPGRFAKPYFEYSRDAGTGSSIRPFVTETNEYPVQMRLGDASNRFRGGLRMEQRFWQLTLEQGGSIFHDDERAQLASRSTGNRTAPFLGQELFLNTLDQRYNVDGSAVYSMASLNVQPVEWLILSGRVLLSRSETNPVYFHSASGRIADLSPVLILEANRRNLVARVRQPHNSGGFDIELRLHPRLRLFESFLIDRLRNDPRLAPDVLDPFELNYTRQSLDAIWDVRSGLTLRMGHRYTWSDGNTRTARTAPVPLSFQRTSFSGPSYTGGVSYRIASRLFSSFDIESTSYNGSWFRTSLRDFTRARARVQYQLFQTLSLAVRGNWLTNENRGIEPAYELDDKSISFSVNYLPPSKVAPSLLLDYTRSSLASNVFYFIPQTLERADSLYRDRTHTATALGEWGRRVVRVAAGGSLVRAEGSRKAYYYQPQARMTASVAKRIDALVEWR